MIKIIIPILLTFCVLFANADANNNTDKKLILHTEKISTSMTDREEYYKFLSKFGWQREVFDNAFPETIYEDCIKNKTLSTTKIKYQGRQGVVDGWVIQPKSTKDSKKLPLIIHNRGGASKWGRFKAIDLFNLCYLANKGFAVLASDFRGSQIKGSDKKFELDKTDLGYGDVYDSIDLIQVAKELGTIDSGRIGLWGASRGTMINAMMLTQLDQIKAVVSLGVVGTEGGQSERRKDFDEHVYPFIYDGWHELTLEKQDELLRGISPYNLADDIKSTPAFLFLHGGKDWRTPAADMLEYAAKLQRNKHAIDIVMYADGSHSLFEHHDKAMEHTAKWFEKHLK